MIKMENHLGTIEISEQFFTSLISDALSDSFGVAGLAPARPRKKVCCLPSRKRVS